MTEANLAYAPQKISPPVETLCDLAPSRDHIQWFDTFPIKAVQVLGKLTAGRLTPAFKSQRVDEVLRFFGVASSDGGAAQLKLAAR